MIISDNMDYDLIFIKCPFLHIKNSLFIISFISVFVFFTSFSARSKVVFDNAFIHLQNISYTVLLSSSTKMQKFDPVNSPKK